MIFVAFWPTPIAGFESVAPDAKLDDGNFYLDYRKTKKLLNMLSLDDPAYHGACTMKM